jgi:hypothetical protein
MSKLKTQNQNSNVKTSGTQGGQTLVEVLAGLGLILIVVTALIGMGVVALKTSTAARNQTVAAKLADEGMEIARSVRDQSGFTALTSVPAQGIDVDGDGDDDFTRQTDVSLESAGKKRVVVTVSWSESSGTKSVSVSSYLTDWR